MRDANQTRVVFVDDDANILSALARSLRAERGQFDMIFTTDPGQALESLQESRGAILVTDWMMPAMDGIALCARAREWANKSSPFELYVIVATGKTSTDDVVHALDNGADDFVKKPVDSRELLARIKVGKRLLESERSLREANLRLERMSSTDALTGAWNRRRAQEVLAAEVSRTLRCQEDLSVLLLDVDRFKQVNDQYGHQAGDTTLIEVVARATGVIRAYDTLARWGGEEFLVVCPQTNADSARSVAERIRQTVRGTPIALPGWEAIGVSVSVGVATSGQVATVTAEELTNRADQALYAAKRSGRDRVETWHEAMAR